MPHNDYNSRTVTMKLSTQPSSKLRLKSNVTYYKADGEIYDHVDVNGYSFDFNLDGLPVFEKEAYLAGITGNWTLSENSILSATVNRFSTMTETTPEHLQGTYYTEWPGYSVDEQGVYNGLIDDSTYGANVDYSDPMQLTGFLVNDDFDPTYHKRESAYNSFNLSFVNQVNKSNQIKAGFEYRDYDISWDFIQFYNQRPYGEKYTSRPKIASAFIQDKLEYDYFIINFGVRYDYHDADISYNATPDTTATWKEAEAKTQFSPRLGVSFPISEKSVMHFNYGFYYQAPAFQYLYTNLQGDLSSGYPLLGNPNLEPEETVSYELGLDHVIGEDLRLDVTAYYKDIKDLVTTRQQPVSGSEIVTTFDNDDYGSVKGIDLALEKLPDGGFLSASVSYSYMVAMGNGSDAYDPYYTYITSPETHDEPITEYPLDFDQRHTVTAVLDYRVPTDWNGSFMGLGVPGGWGLNVVGHYGSGLPYTPIDTDGSPLGERNEGRLPANYTVDLRLNKDFPLGSGNQLLSFFVEVDNVFDRRNVIDVYARTGEPDDNGSSITASQGQSQAEFDYYDRLYDHDPQNYSKPRTVRTGLEFTF
ncbi:TonB-dependent receptor [candidate division GN15 bacterium]|nr:TonB-dependent receptor [candidate division GN15 bacterium]